MQNSSISKHIIIWIVAIALFIDALDATIINTAIPTIARYMMINPVDLKIALISYLLSLALFIPISGWLADKYGQRNIFVLAVIIFTVSSMLCGLSENLWQLMLARFLQGIGGAMMSPVGRLIAVRSVPRSQFINIMNRIVLIALIGPALGPFLGGVITDWFSWRWIFYVNVPLGIIEIFVAWNLISNDKEPSTPPLDKIGFILFGTSLGLLVFSLSALSEQAFQTSKALYLLAIAVIGFITYFWYSQKQAFPLLDLTLFKVRTFAISNIGASGIRIASNAIPFLCPLLFQVSDGLSPFISGVLMIPYAIGAMAAKICSRRLAQQFGLRHYLIVVNLGASLSIFSLSLITGNSALWFMAALVFFSGLSSSLLFSGTNPMAFADIDKKNLSKATSIVTTNQQAANSLGVAFGAFFLVMFSKHYGDKHHLPASVFHHTFIVLSIASFFVTFIFLKLHKEDGATLFEKNQI